MSWREWFRSPPPLPPQDDPHLGLLTWVEGQDGWCGMFNGFQFVLCHEGSSAPPEGLRASAVEVLSDRDHLQASLARAIEQAPTHLKRFIDEMRELSYEELSFSADTTARSIFATLGPGRDYRCWRLEFEDMKCLGIGFDT